jgi:putative flippase GtrA
MARQLLRFGMIGGCALLIHWLVALALVPLGIPPLLANVFGFTVAFQVSYLGHRRWTFCAAALCHKQTLLRFAIVSLSSFMINELLYFLLLSYTTLDYQTALVMVLAIVSTITYLLSRQWAFSKT